MATTKETKSVDLRDDDIFYPEPTAAPPNVLARQDDVDWLIGRETCGFFSSDNGDGNTWWANWCPYGDTCTISDSYIGCSSWLRTACSETSGSYCPGGGDYNSEVTCCTGTNYYCATAIMTLGETDFLTGFSCNTQFDGEVKLYPSVIEDDDEDETTTTTTSGGTKTTPEVISDPIPPPTTTVDPEPRNGPDINVGAVAGGVIGGVGILIVVVCCAFYFRRRRSEESAGRGPRTKPVVVATDYPYPPYANTYEKPDDQLPRSAAEMPPFSTVGSNTVAELPGHRW